VHSPEEVATCPVCAGPVHRIERRCASCLAPHHADCWSYNRGCGIYACHSRSLQGGGLLHIPRSEDSSRFLALAFAMGLLVFSLLRELVRLTLSL
jgi:hypothetical protein